MPRELEFVPDEFQCPVCGFGLDYESSSELYHRYECSCGAKLLVPKKEEKRVNKE